MYNFDYNALLTEFMPSIHSSKLQQDIKDSWIALALECNIQYLHEPVVVF